jgi:hypothetical protein
MLGYNGASDSSANATFLFDDIQQVATLSDGIDQTLNLDDISIYPNPAKDILTISSKNKSIKTIALFDILGNQVTVLNPNSLSATIDVSDFASGIYIARISTPTATGSLKVVIE